MSERKTDNTRNLTLAIFSLKDNTLIQAVGGGPWRCIVRMGCTTLEVMYDIAGRGMKNKLLVSACLMGFSVRYNGSEKANLTTQLARWQREDRVVIHCPELAAGLPTPRLPAEIVSADGADVMGHRARIIENDGRDVTAHYQLAAWLALQTAMEQHCGAALLTDGSPTCGSQFIYDGSFSGIRKAGMGVAAALLREHGIAVFSERQIPALIAWMEKTEEEYDPVSTRIR